MLGASGTCALTPLLQQGHCMGRAVGNLHSQSCLGTGNAQGKILPVCLLSQQLPASSLVLPSMSFIRSASFQRVARPQ